MVKISGVVSGSPAERAGVIPCDCLVSINNHPVRDVLDYMFYAAEENVALEILRDGKPVAFTLKKGEYDDIGLEFDTFLMDSKQSCRNKCVFCFIDQMPPGMRETLYFKDDDARLSFLQGNYVTLTNLEQSDIDRIIRMKLNINVSVHTTNPELRCRMMNNRFAGEKLKYIRQLAENGIMLNCQIVCCPGLNDGEELRRSLTDLGALMPNISSMAVVPVGLTRFRSGLYPLTPFDKKSSLIDEFEKALESAEWSGGKRSVSIACGYAPYKIISALAEKAEQKFPELCCHIYRIRNDFFGDTITVTGLITAQDLIAQLKEKPLGEELLISSSMLRAEGSVFLDDKTVSDVEKALNVRIKPVSNDGFELLDAIMGAEY